MDQHLVDDELEEDRRRQAEGVEDDRGQRDVDEEPLLADELGHEPAKAERLLGVRHLVVALDEDDAPAPARAELILAQDQEFGPHGEGIEHPDEVLGAAGLGAGQDHPIAIVEFRQRRIGVADLHQAGPGQLFGAGAQARLLRHAQQQAKGDRSIADGVVVDQAIGREVDAVVACDMREAINTRMNRFGHGSSKKCAARGRRRLS